MNRLRLLAGFLVAVFILFLCPAHADEVGDYTMEFKSVIKTRIIEVLESWPVRDQYAIMFFIYPNECYDYGGYSNIPEFRMLYKCESEMKRSFFPRFGASSKDEERWNPAFWNFDRRETVIGFEHANSIADALIRWYEDVGVQDIGYEDTDSVYDSDMIYIGKGPNGLQELLKLVAEIASELQTEGYIEAKFGRKIPIIIADFEFTWYMLAATRSANPNGEADEYIEACLRHGWALEEQIYGSDF